MSEYQDQDTWFRAECKIPGGREFIADFDTRELAVRAVSRLIAMGDGHRYHEHSVRRMRGRSE